MNEILKLKMMSGLFPGTCTYKYFIFSGRLDINSYLMRSHMRIQIPGGVMQPKQKLCKLKPPQQTSKT